MKNTMAAAGAAFLAFVAGTAAAQQVGGGVGLGISTMGAVVEGHVRANEAFGMRALYAGTPSYDDTTDIDGIDYDVDGRLGGFAVLGDFYPGGRNVRLSAGVFVSESELNGMATGTATNPIQVGSAVFSSGETIETDVTFRNEFAPMATLGYVHEVNSGFSLSAEAGVILTDGFNVSATGTGIPQAEIDAEVNDIRAELDKYKVYPFISLTAAFRF